MSDSTLSSPASTETSPGSKTNIVMSGMRPTGKLHLGHYMGVLKNWVTLQHQYQCYFMVADWHALTTAYDQTENLVDNIYEMALDWLAAGVDPEKCVMYVQSAIPETAELHLLFSMITPAKWVQTDPTLKDMVAALNAKPEHEAEDLSLSYGLLGYPVLQTVDILGMKGALVPVGKDQLAHLEISRDIARRFNHMYNTDMFAEPRPLLTETPMLMGLDGRKMSKSYGNTIMLSETAEETWQKVRTAITDPARVKRTDPGEPENCEVVFKYYEAFAPKDAIDLAATECRTATRGCMDCKKILADFINEQMAPMRERRAVYASDRAQVDRLLREGSEKARAVCADTLRQVKDVMRLL